MLVFTMSQLLSLAKTYSDATGIELKTLGSRAADNWKLFTRLADNKGCSAKGAEAATVWFIDAWPDTVPWPIDVPDVRSLERRRAASRVLGGELCAAGS
jgi:hypothetical protein